MLEAQKAAAETKAQRKLMRRLRREQEERQVCIGTGFECSYTVVTCSQLEEAKRFLAAAGLAVDEEDVFGSGKQKKKKKRKHDDADTTKRRK